KNVSASSTCSMLTTPAKASTPFWKSANLSGTTNRRRIRSHGVADTQGWITLFTSLRPAAQRVTVFTGSCMNVHFEEHTGQHGFRIAVASLDAEKSLNALSLPMIEA